MHCANVFVDKSRDQESMIEKEICELIGFVLGRETNVVSVPFGRSYTIIMVTCSFQLERSARRWTGLYETPRCGTLSRW